VLNERRQVETRREVELENLKTEVRRLQEQVDGLAGAQQRVYEELDGLRESGRSRRRETEDKMRGLEDSVKAVASSSRRIREEVVGDISKKLEGVLGSQRSRGAGGQAGYEHVVQAGETLSEIAAAYKVSVSVIVGANGLKDPDAIRVGQTLFIPE